MRRHKALVLLRRSPENEERVRSAVGCRVMGGNAEWILVFDKRRGLSDYVERNPADAWVVPSHRASVDRLPAALRAELGVPLSARTVYEALVELTDEKLLDETL